MCGVWCPSLPVTGTRRCKRDWEQNRLTKDEPLGGSSRSRRHKKRERPHHDRSLGLHHRGVQEQRMADAPRAGATDQHCVLYSWTRRSKVVVSREAELTFASRRIVISWSWRTSLVFLLVCTSACSCRTDASMLAKRQSVCKLRPTSLWHLGGHMPAEARPPAHPHGIDDRRGRCP